MKEELHINPTVSAIVMLAAIVSTYSIYSAYKDDQVATEYQSVQESMDQTASAILSLKAMRATETAAVIEASTTPKESGSGVQYGF